MPSYSTKGTRFLLDYILKWRTMAASARFTARRVAINAGSSCLLEASGAHLVVSIAIPGVIPPRAAAAVRALTPLTSDRRHVAAILADRLATLSPGLPGLFRGELVCCAFRVSRAPAFAGYSPLSLAVHGGKSSPVIAILAVSSGHYVTPSLMITRATGA